MSGFTHGYSRTFRVGASTAFEACIAIPKPTKGFRFINSTAKQIRDGLFEVIANYEESTEPIADEPHIIG